MKNSTLPILALSALAAAALHAQAITGNWQGTLKTPARDLRIVIKLALDDDKLKGTFYSIDQQSPAIPSSAVTRDGSNLKMTYSAIGVTYEGKLSQDANSITGTFTQGGMPTPLNLARATPETAWAIPEPPPPPRQMPRDAKPVFEISTVKPTKPDVGFSIRVAPSGMFTTTGTPLSDLIIFAYGIQRRQISGAPAWAESDRFDITGKPNVEGMPNDPQLRAMLQGLLAERFQLAFHREKREMQVYAISVAKAGLKIAENTLPNAGNLPGFGLGFGRLTIQNATIQEVAGVMQAQILDQPVVDQTGLGEKRYNFTLLWTPDANQYAGRGFNALPPESDKEPPPDLFTAVQQQLGLKLESTKAPVDVLVLDKVEKPSDN